MDSCDGYSGDLDIEGITLKFNQDWTLRSCQTPSSLKGVSSKKEGLSVDPTVQAFLRTSVQLREAAMKGCFPRTAVAVVASVTLCMLPSTKAFVLYILATAAETDTI